ncbi:hypothetical protein Scep_030280 [Stephania cephalantha]|uniref:Uncharacterized protein n=1 Tax=Stephania cephalantha TaxID=152367 RepID=A0AAP0DZA1_9MAGN
MAYNGGLNSKIHSSSSRAIHLVVELRRSPDALSTVVVSHRGSIGPATRHRVVAPCAISPLMRATTARRRTHRWSRSSLLASRWIAPPLVVVVTPAPPRPRLRLNRRRDRRRAVAAGLR